MELRAVADRLSGPFPHVSASVEAWLHEQAAILRAALACDLEPVLTRHEALQHEHACAEQLARCQAEFGADSGYACQEWYDAWIDAMDKVEALSSAQVQREGVG